MPRDIPTQKRIFNGFTKHEVAELIRRIGIAKGYDVIDEFAIGVGGRTRKIDWVWRQAHGGPVVHAFEIEGRNVQRDSLNMDIEKFTELRRLQGQHDVSCWLVLYSCRFKDQDWFQLNDGQTRIEGIVGVHGVETIMDLDMVRRLNQVD